MTQTKYAITIDVDELHTLIFEAGGAATRPLLEDNPDYVFPSERVAQAINELLEANGLPTREVKRVRIGFDCERVNLGG